MCIHNAWQMLCFTLYMYIQELPIVRSALISLVFWLDTNLVVYTLVSTCIHGGAYYIGFK